jgi:hypothetical protein
MKHTLTVIASCTLALWAMPAPAQALRDPAETLAQADSNHDGKITRAEFHAARQARFDSLDRNGDGVISRADFARIIAFRPQVGTRIDAFIAQADANHDGQVTRDELAHAPDTLFDQADANHDGVIDQSELAAASVRLRTMQKAR